MSFYFWIIIALAYLLTTHFIARYMGEKRRIGYGKSVLWSILFSPVVGLIITALSPVKQDS